MNFIEIEETYNKQGVCVKRTANGIEIKNDTEPSVCFVQPSATTHMTIEEFHNGIYKGKE